jgi:hypothetical protein
MQYLKNVFYYTIVSSPLLGLAIWVGIVEPSNKFQMMVMLLLSIMVTVLLDTIEEVTELRKELRCTLGTNSLQIPLPPV